MIQEYQLRILPEIAASEQQLKAYLSQEKGLNQRDITALRTLKRSIDARQRTIYVNLKVRVYLNEMPKDDEYEHTIYNNVEGKPQVIVVGAGPRRTPRRRAPRGPGSAADRRGQDPHRLRAESRAQPPQYAAGRRRS